MNEPKQELMKQIQEYSFAALDVSLYLNTHPQDQNAKMYFDHYEQLYIEAKAAYEQTYGPLTANALTDNTSWLWAEQAWPWQKEA